MNLSGEKIIIGGTFPYTQWVYKSAPSVVFGKGNGHLCQFQEITDPDTIVILDATHLYPYLHQPPPAIAAIGQAAIEKDITRLRARSKNWKKVYLLHREQVKISNNNFQFVNDISLPGHTYQINFHITSLTPQNLREVVHPTVYVRIFPVPYYILLEKICPIEDLQVLILEFLGLQQ